jgi:hypothetical protein
MRGVEDFVVARNGKGRLRPQSPLEREDGGVVIVRWVGCGEVAVSEPNVTVDAKSCPVRDKGAGIENIRDALRRAAPGETPREAIAAKGFLRCDCDTVFQTEASDANC